MKSKLLKLYRHPLFVVLVYAVFGLLWIKYSDQLLEYFVSDVSTLSRLQTWKGWFFIITTSLLLYLLVRDNIRRNLAHQEMTQQLMMKTPIPMVVLEESGRITLLNSAFIETYGYTQDNIRTADDWFLVAYPDEEYRRFVQSQWEKDSKQYEGNMHSSSGKIFDVTDINGNIHHTHFFIMRLTNKFIVLCVDITQQATMEKQLRQAEKMNALGQLAGGIAHDFNNQLAAIGGIADLIPYKKDDTEKLIEITDIIKHSVAHAQELTSQLLLFSRRSEKEDEEFDCNGIVEKLHSIMEHTFPKSIKLSISTEETPLLCKGNPSRMTNALLNLAINAKDSLADRGTISITCEKVNEAVHIKVSDTGTGIPQEILPHIFEPFYTTKEEGKGTGMGLAAVHATITDHGGTISIDTSSEGTTFTIQIPLL